MSNLPKMPDQNETAYESSKKKEWEMKQKGVLRKQWFVPASANYSLQSIPIMISLTSDHALYKGATFRTKEELKMSLRMLALKKKYEYRVRRLSKTHFDTSCKQEWCKFQLRVVGIQEGYIGLLVRLDRLLSSTDSY